MKARDINLKKVNQKFKICGKIAMYYNVFINYRRSDTEGIAGRLYDRLVQFFSADRLFIDVGSISKGADFVEVMSHKISDSDVILALIGVNWLTVLDDSDARRLDDPQDPVRLELERALREKKVVIPILVGKAEMPAAKYLPDKLKPLARRNGERITHENFLGDVDRLIYSIDLAMQEELGRRAANENKNLGEQGGYFSDHTFGRTANSNAPELLEWESIRGLQDADRIRHHLARWENGITAESAYQELERLEWIRVESTSDFDALKWFLSTYPNGLYHQFALQKLSKLQSMSNSGFDHDSDQAPPFVHTSELRAPLKIPSMDNSPSKFTRRIFLPLGAAVVGGISFVGWKFGRMEHSLSPKPIITITNSTKFNSARFSPDGSKILTGEYEAQARIWDANTGAALASLGGHVLPIWCANYSSDSALIGTTSSDNSARIWRTSDNTEIRKLVGHTSDVTHIDFSPDASKVISASIDGTVRIWDTLSGKTMSVLENRKAGALFAEYSPSGNQIVVALTDGTIAVWNAVTALPAFVLYGHQDYVRSASFSNDGTKIVTASDDKTVRVYSASTGNQEYLFVGHKDSVNYAVFSPDDKYIVSASSDSSVRVWDLLRKTEFTKIGGHVGVVVTSSFSSDGARLLSASHDGTAVVWEL